jgi:thiamine biosynthesis lipoprotein
MEYYDFRAMNSNIVLAADSSPEQAGLGFLAARAFIAAEETRFTRFSPDSELSRLNQAGGEWFKASLPMYNILAQISGLMNQTGGLFNPCILDALEATGYDRSMEHIQAWGAHDRPGGAIAQPIAGCQIELNPLIHAVRLAHGVHIDLGGIAKGWIAQTAAHVLAAYCPACVVNAGGDLFATGLPLDKPAWEVALEDPCDPQNILAVLQVGPGAVTTSSITKRRWVQNGRLQHHLIDPRTGLPAQTDWLSVTVIAPEATVAEVFAKSLLIAGSRDAARLTASRPEIAFIAVDGQGRLWGSDRAKEYMDVKFEGATL